VWHKILWLAVAGAAGTLARYALAGGVHRFTGQAYPWGTLTVNAIGCLLFGLVWSVSESRLLISPQARPFILTGFMGAFTTFSTYAFESSQLMRDGQWIAAIANIASQNMLGLACTIAGFALGRCI
jgi:CrcB protein